MKALSEQKDLPQWKKENGRYIPAPGTWLTGRCWEDKPPDDLSDHGHSYDLDEYKSLVNRF